MPAKSKAQQRFFGMVHAAQMGDTKASPEVSKAAESMSKKSAKDFASTSQAGLPEHKKPKKHGPGHVTMIDSKIKKI